MSSSSKHSFYKLLKTIHRLTVIGLILSEIIISRNNQSCNLSTPANGGVSEVHCTLTWRAVPCPVPWLAALIARAPWSRPCSHFGRSSIIRRNCWAISCPMPFLSTLKAGRTSSYNIPFVVCLAQTILHLCNTTWNTSSCRSMLIAPLEEPTRASLNQQNNDAINLLHTLLSRLTQTHTIHDTDCKFAT